MTSQTILVIDDSATIRKLVDSHLTQEGYRVFLAPTAEKGLELAREVRPDLILLDHQLPGTTGIEICRQIIEFPECASVPFVVSSTLRKQAYAEYMSIPNVVDSLHKPFKPELLKMTVANALETGAMIVSSQSQGTAVPEVIDEMDKGALSGEFQHFRLREILDFLNNGMHSGMLEVEAEHDRFWFYLEEGRMQSVVSSSVDEATVAGRLPESLAEMASLLRFTMSSGFSAHVEGLVSLLDKRVLDPRMLRALLRHQAAVLTWLCFRTTLKAFTFAAGRPLPPLFRRSPLETSLAALLVEGALVCPEEELSPDEESLGWTRSSLRGQNLDRTGLSPRNVQLLSALDTPLTAQALADRLEAPVDEVRRALHGFELAEWVRRERIEQRKEVLALEPDQSGATLLRRLLMQDGSVPAGAVPAGTVPAGTVPAGADWTGKVVRDPFGMQLLLKRTVPDVLLLAVDDESHLELLRQIQHGEHRSALDSGTMRNSERNMPADRVCLIVDALAETLPDGEAFDAYPVLRRPYEQADVLRVLEQAGSGSTPVGAGT
jgi:CheY-like chemotaxis protein